MYYTHPNSCLSFEWNINVYKAYENVVTRFKTINIYDFFIMVIIFCLLSLNKRNKTYVIVIMLLCDASCNQEFTEFCIWF
jgi:hypothetical protein